MNKSTTQYQLGIILIGLLLFVPFLGSVHLFDWDEINFAECAREMIVTGDFFSVTINFQPFWEKPPVFIWMQVLSMKTFGINEFSARFPNAVCGVVTLLVLFNIGRKLYNNQFGLVWVLVYIGSFLPFFYFKSGIIDPWFNLFIFTGLYYFILFKTDDRLFYLIVSGLLIGLGVLTKGPVAILIFGLCISVFWVINSFKPVITFKQIVIYGFTVTFVGSLWFLMLAVTGNIDIIKEFFMYQVRLFNTQDSGHGGPFIYHWIVLLIGCFPLSIFALRAFASSATDSPEHKYFKQWMLILFWVVLILFSIVKTKIVHYSSLCYFPLSFLGAYAVYKLLNGEIKWKKISSVLLIFVSSIMGIVFSLLPIIDKNKNQLIDSNLIKDKFAVENIKADVAWSGYEWLIGVVLIVGVGLMLLLIKKNKVREGVIGIFLISLFTVNMASIVITPRIEQYSQGTAIEFYESLQDKDCYVDTYGFKSYAHLFYAHTQSQVNVNSYDLEWLLRGEIDKPAYIVCKITSLNVIKEYYPELKEIYRKNGFVFFVRHPKG